MHMIIRTTMWNSNIMPSEIQKAKFYEPSDNGHEKEIKEWMEFLKKNS